MARNDTPGVARHCDRCRHVCAHRMGLYHGFVERDNRSLTFRDEADPDLRG